MTGETKNKGNLLNRMTVAQRIYSMALVPLLLLTAIGVGSIHALSENERAMGDIAARVTAIDAGNKMIRRTQRDYLILLYETSFYDTTYGSYGWEGAEKQLKRAQSALRDKTLPRYLAAQQNIQMSDEERKKIDQVERTVNELLKEMDIGLALLQKNNSDELRSYLLNNVGSSVRPARDAIHAQVQADIEQSEKVTEAVVAKAKSFLTLGVLSIVIGMLIVALMGFLIYHSISSQISKLTGTIRDISAGDLNARVELKGNNELVELGDAFDGMVEERIVTQRRINEEHEQLNDSVFALLEAVADLSDRNLTVRAVVTEDATGPLADAINQLAEDTGATLLQVREVAELVESTSSDVNQHALAVNKLSELERTEAEETTQQLARILEGLNSIAESAQQADSVANITSATTRSAQASVSRMLGSISGIRDNVQETGKRLKRLGERSQEISRIVDIINTISERTTVLALNANMQATAAGEAGRGFSVIAEEIQHLAESSRESTEQIGVLVRNIQQEANTTMTNMDETISEVVGGSTLAEQAAEQMDATLEATTRLVTSVGKIAADSADQASIGHELQRRASRILEATQATGKELLSLTGLTSNMASYGQRLAQAIKVFKLER